MRLGKLPSKLVSWGRNWLGGSKWLGKTYHYRLDRAGFVWLNLDWIDNERVQRPGAPYKAYERATIYYPSANTWETEGEPLDSNGNPKLQYSVVESLAMGMR